MYELAASLETVRIALRGGAQRVFPAAEVTLHVADGASGRSAETRTAGGSDP